MLICQSIIFIHKLFFCIIEIPQNYLPGINVLYMFFPHNFPNVFSIIAGNFTLLSCNQNTLIKHFFCFVLKSGKKLKFSYLVFFTTWQTGYGFHCTIFGQKPITQINIHSFKLYDSRAGKEKRIEKNRNFWGSSKNMNDSYSLTGRIFFHVQDLLV